jgi:hypothetical protein
MKSLSPLTETAQQEKNILLPLLYFDIFNYPLTEEEIMRFAPSPLAADFGSDLVNLTDRQLVYRFGDYYSVTNDPSSVDRRKAGNALAQKKMPTARKFARLMASFPFVRAVMLSGSISKGYMDDRSDIDYFIIAESGRLWLVRTAMALFRRIFLLNSHKYFCTNYFVGSKALEIGEKNIFTAVETATLKPVYGKNPFFDFQSANSWCDSFLPNRTIENGVEKERDFFLKKGWEKILSLSLFDKLDDWLMVQSIKHWKKKYGQQLNTHDFLIAFQSTPQVSRSHPNFYQKKVLSRYAKKIKAFEEEQGISLSV